MDRDAILAASFEGLDDASGDVKALPLRIAGLLADDEADRRDAVHAVSYRLFQHGTLATATARAVPILIEIALAPYGSGVWRGSRKQECADDRAWCRSWGRPGARQCALDR